MEQDDLIRAHARLQAFNESFSIRKMSETDVLEFHEILDSVELAGIPSSEFRIPDNALQRRVTSSQSISPILKRYVTENPPPTYSRERYVDKALFQSKVRAALNYVSQRLQDSESSAQIADAVTESKPSVGDRSVDVINSLPQPGPFVASIVRNFGWSSVIWIVVGLLIALVLKAIGFWPWGCQ